MSLFVCQNEQGELLFLQEEKFETLISLAEVEKLLNQGQREDLMELFVKITSSMQFQQVEEEIKEQILQAQKQVNDFQDDENDVRYDEEPVDYEEEQRQTQMEDNNDPQENTNGNDNEEQHTFKRDINEKSIALNRQFSKHQMFLGDGLQMDQNHTEVQQIKRMVDENLIKMKARVQLLKTTEQRNLQKAKQIDRNVHNLENNKISRYQRKITIEKIQEEEALKMQKKREEIKQQKEKHQLFLNGKRDEQGEKYMQKLNNIQSYKQQLRSNYENTMGEVYQENRVLYEKVRTQQAHQQRKLASIQEQKMQQAQINYQKKIAIEMNFVSKKQQLLEELELNEHKLLSQLKLTQQVYQNSSSKLSQLKNVKYEDIAKYQSQ